MGWRDDRSSSWYGPCSWESAYRELESAYRNLEYHYRSLQEENAQLRERLDIVEPSFHEAFDSLTKFHGVAQTLEGEMHLAHAQRDLLYEVAKVLVGPHDYERHDGRVWCGECRYEFPYKTRQIADHAIRGVSELGPINRV